MLKLKDLMTKNLNVLNQLTPKEVLEWKTALSEYMESWPNLIEKYPGLENPETVKSLFEEYPEFEDMDIQELLKTLSNKDPNFYLMLQGKVTNTLTKIKASSLIPEQMDLLGHNATIEVDDTFTLTIKEYDKLKNGISTTAHQLLDGLLIHFTEAGTKDVRVRLPLKKYMEMRGLKDEKGARQQVLEDIEALKSIEYKAREKIKGKWIRSGSISLYGGTGFIKNGIIYFNFNADFYKTLLNYKVMEYSKETLKINTKRNPHAYYFSRYIDENYRLNEGMPRVNIISIAALISKAPLLPSYETVMEATRAISQRIIIPVIRDLDSIEHLNYQLLDQDNNMVEDIQRLSYAEFIACKIKIDYINYPAHQKRIANKKLHISEAIKASKKTPKTKN
jgi:hypothetical protein